MDSSCKYKYFLQILISIAVCMSSHKEIGGSTGITPLFLYCCCATSLIFPLFLLSFFDCLVIFTMGKDIGSVILFGLINTFMVVPISISFCEIIFRDEVFDEYMPSLVKLVLFSSAIHQLCFSLFSSLPFAVGQVQDAGLIFLSAMAGSVATSCSKPENIVPSTLFILGSSTAILGVMLMIVSKLKLASVVQYLPMPVIGGYLAFIGFFCGEAGLSMMAGVQVTSISQWYLFLDRDAFILLLPGLICGLGMSYSLHKFPSPLTFPVCLISILSVFYLAMFLSGSSLQDMRDAGWISPLDKAGSSFDAWKLYDISKVEWNLFPKQIITLLGMFLVVAFSSSLDVAAIEMELGLPLDYNRELNTVGISNLVSGLFGGYTGSYIFTQTTFNMRRGINSRLCGFIIVAGEIIIALLPVSVVSFIPKLFFGSLLVLIATELLCEWLIFARTKMMQYEYAVCLLTFACIQMVGIELGMLIGVIAAMFCFVISYSNLQSVSAVTVKSSTVIRTFEERSVLIANRGKVLTVSLNGYLFFGSAVKLLQEIKSKLVAADDDVSLSEFGVSSNAGAARADGYSPIATNSSNLSPTASQSAKIPRPRDGNNLPHSSLDDHFSSTATSLDNKHQQVGSKSKSAFEGMTPLKTMGKQSSFMATSVSHSQSHHASSSVSYQQQNQAGAHHGEENLSSSHHPMRMLFSSHSMRQKHIPTVYDLSADQIQSHYESWANAQKPAPLERKSTMNSERKHPSNSDLEMGSLQQSHSHHTSKSSNDHSPNHKPKTVVAHKALDSDWIVGDAAAPKTPAIAINERTSLLTAAINPSYSKEAAPAASSTSPMLSSSLTPRGLEDVKEIRESSVFLQVWESQQQRKEQTQQRRRRSFSDLAGLATSPGQIDQNDYLDRAKASLGFNYDSQENLDNLQNNNLTAADEKSRLLRTNSGNKSPRTSFNNNNNNNSGANNTQQSLASGSGKHAHTRSSGKLQSTPASSSSSSDVPANSSNRKSLSTANNTNNASSALPTSMLQSAESSRHLATNNNNAAATTAGTNVSQQDMVTEYLILDFTGVMGVDATAARACFLTLVQFMRTANVTVVFAHLSKAVEDLLRAHNVLNEDSIMIPNLDDALEWCEDQILVDNDLKESDGAMGEAGGLLTTTTTRTRSVEEYSRAWSERQQHSLIGRPRLPSASSMSKRSGMNGNGNSANNFGSNIDLLSLAEDFSSSGKPISARALRHILVDYLGLDLSNPSNRFRQLLESSVLTKFFTREEVKAGQIIFDIDFPATKVFFIECGTVEIVSLTLDASMQQQTTTPTLRNNNRNANNSNSSSNNNEVVRVNKASHGGVFGEADFILGKNRTVRAYSVTDSTFWILDREHFAAMEVQQPQLCMLIQYALLRSLALSYTCSMYALHPTTAYADNGDDV